MSSRIIYPLLGVGLIASLILLIISHKDPSEQPLKVIGQNEISTNGGADTAGYARISSLGETAAFLLKKKDVRGQLQAKELALMIVDSHPNTLFPPGVVYHVREDGLLVDAFNNALKVSSDGNYVWVEQMPKGQSVKIPIF